MSDAITSVVPVPQLGLMLSHIELPALAAIGLWIRLLNTRSLAFQATARAA